MQEYNFEWEYIKGSENKVPDTLSRIDMLYNKTGRDLKEIEIFQISREDRIFGEEMRDIKTMQRADGKSGKVIESLENELSRSEYSQYFQVYNGLLFKRVVGGERVWKLVVPEGLVEKVVWDCHLRYGHFGAKKCVSVLKESCVFRNMERRVRRLLKGCDLCQKSKVVNYRVEGEMNFIKVERRSI